MTEPQKTHHNDSYVNNKSQSGSITSETPLTFRKCTCQLNVGPCSAIDDVGIMEEVLKQILAELECPVCLEYMVGDITLCQQGHSTCKTCKDKIRSHCPICKSVFAVQRNFTLEQVAAKLTYPCRNDGCKAILKANEVREHERYCEKIMYRCCIKHNDCPWSGKLNEIRPHIEQCHMENVEKWRSNGFAQIYVTFNEENTFVVSFSQTHNISMYSGMYIGPSIDSDDFILNVEFEDQTGKGYKLLGASPCIPLGSFEDVFEGNHITFGSEMLRHFLGSNNYYASKITITRK